MKIFHISDLHIGKQLHFYNLKKSQQDILKQIAGLVEIHRPDAVVIAGDIYDKSVPSGEAYEIFDAFLNDLAKVKPAVPVMIIAGNHDSAMRLKFASAFLERNQIYISVMPPQKEDEHLKKITFKDEYGNVNFYMLPFTKPGYVRGLFEDGEIEDYNSAVKAVIDRENIDYSERNILIAHQFFVSGAKEPDKCSSENKYISVGGLDSVDVECVKQFDYVALGHIHGAQNIGEDYIRYSGTPLKYSVSEEHHKKSITVITMGEKGSDNTYEQIPLEMKPDVRSIRGTLEEVIAMANDETKDDYVSITLTDEDSIYRPKDQLEEHYTNILEVQIDNKRVRSRLENEQSDETSLKPFEAFKEFYQEMNDQPLSDEEAEIMADVINKVAETEL